MAAIQRSGVPPAPPNRASVGLKTGFLESAAEGGSPRQSSRFANLVVRSSSNGLARREPPKVPCG